MRNYSRLEREADDDSVALIMGRAPPRLAMFGATDYVELENLDEDGRATDDRQAQIHKRFQRNVTNGSRKMVLLIVAIVCSVVIGAGVHTFFRDRHKMHGGEYYKPVLTESLDFATRLNNGTHEFHRSTLLISLDGMHPHYVSKIRTPNMHNMVNSEFVTPYMLPSFPTQTFPNHWTLVTGMHPVNHGIVGNSFYDPELGLTFRNDDQELIKDVRFWGGEPLWATARKSGLFTAVHMWPGSNANWDEESNPNEVVKFDQNESLYKKAKQIYEWLDRGKDMPQLMLSYVPNIDTVGHRTGIMGSEMMTELSMVDGFIGKVRTALEERNLTDIVNVVIVSDHGMAPTSNERLVFLDDVVETYGDIALNLGWPLAGLRFNTISEADIAFDDLPEKKIGYSAYKSDNMPEDWHFSKGKLHERALYGDDDEDDDEDEDGDDNDGKKDDEKTPPEKPEKPKNRPQYGRYRQRLADLYIVPHVGYSLLTHQEWDDMNHDYFLKGVHGYSKTEPLMRAMFLAQGPAFPPGTYYPFSNVDVYSAICRSVGIEPSEISDGDFRGVRMKRFYAGPENYPGTPFSVDTFPDTSYEKFFNQHDG